MLICINKKIVARAPQIVLQLQAEMGKTGLYPGDVLQASQAHLPPVKPEQSSYLTSKKALDPLFKTRKQKRNLDFFSIPVRSQMLMAHRSYFTHLKNLVHAESRITA